MARGKNYGKQVKAVAVSLVIESGKSIVAVSWNWKFRKVH